MMKLQRRPGGPLRRAAVGAGLLAVSTLLLSSCDESSSGGSNATEGNVGPATSGHAVTPQAGLVGDPGPKKFQPGDLKFVPASGPTTASPSWTTKGACPPGHNASAELVAFNLQGDFESRISLPIDGPGPYTSAPGAGVLDFDLNKVRLYATPDVGPDGTIEVAVGCYADGAGLGSAVFVQSIFIHFSANGATYSTSSSG
jgi:hypothetical protein